MKYKFNTKHNGLPQICGNPFLYDLEIYIIKYSQLVAYGVVGCGVGIAAGACGQVVAKNSSVAINGASPVSILPPTKKTLGSTSSTGQFVFAIKPEVVQMFNIIW